MKSEKLEDIIFLYFRGEGSIILVRLLTLDFMRILLNILISGIAVAIAAYLTPGAQVDGYMTAVIVAVVLAIVNSTI
jgi:uncharacterized membrane protein YvlD (DUF360 family)